MLRQPCIDLKAVRKVLGLGQTEFADVLGTSLRTVQSCEQGWRNPGPAVEKAALLLLMVHHHGPDVGTHVCWDSLQCPERERNSCLVYQARQGHLCWLLSAGVLWACGAAPAGAYILRGPHIIDLMVRQMGRPDTLMVSQRVMYYEDRVAGSVVQARETVRYVFPDAFRSDSISAYAERTRLTVRGQGLTIVDGRVVWGDAVPLDAYKDLLMYRSRPLLAQRLSDLGVDIRSSSLDRFEDSIVLVLGTETPDETVSQVWVDKETFKPVRWLMPGRADDGSRLMREVRYLDWRQVNSVWYPMHMQFFENGVLLREIRVERMKVNLTFPDELFDVDRLRVEHAALVDETDDEVVSEELNEVQESIDEFRKKYE